MGLKFDIGSAVMGGLTGFAMGGPAGAVGGAALGGFSGGQKKAAEKKYMNQMNAIRNDPRRQALIKKYQDKVAGRDLLTPMLYKKRADESVKAQATAMGGQRGLSRGLAARNLSQASSNLGVKEAQNMALLEQQERDQAAQNLNSLLSGQQAMDMNIAKQQYGIDAERAMMPSKMLTTAMQGYGMYQDRQMAQEQMRNQAFNREMGARDGGASNIYNKQAMTDLLMQRHNAMMDRERKRSSTGGVIKGLGEHPPSMGMGY